MSENFFIARHTDRPDKSDSPESAEYSWITERGVEMARSTAEQVAEMVDSAAPDAVVVIAGASEEDRTKSTAEVIGDELAVRYGDDPSVLVLTRSEIDDIRTAEVKPEGFRLLDEIKRILATNPDKKIVIDYPLFLKGFSLRPHFRDSTGTVTELTRTLVRDAAELHADELEAADRSPDPFARTKEEEAIGAKLYMQMDDPELAHAQGGLTPQEAAEQQVRDIGRLRAFVKRFSGERELVLGFVGHAWNLDALASFLANNGEATVEGFEAAGDRMIQLAEMGKIIIHDDTARFVYRGNEFELPREILEERWDS